MMKDIRDIEALHAFFTTFNLNDSKLLKSIQDCLVPVNFDEKSLIFSQNEPATTLFFLPKGIARYYVLDHEGNEHTKSFRVGPTFLGSVYAIQGGETNPFTAQLLQAVSLYFLDISYWQALLNENISFVKFYNHFISQLFIDKEKRELSFLQDSVEKQYSQFQMDYKDYLTLIPKWMIASFLGITPEALSRIRKRQG